MARSRKADPDTHERTVITRRSEYDGLWRSRLYVSYEEVGAKGSVSKGVTLRVTVRDSSLNVLLGQRQVR